MQAVGKGIAAVGRTVIAPLLRKLGRIVKPLLKRVIQFAMGKLPPAVRPIARSSPIGCSAGATSSRASRAARRGQRTFRA